MQITLTIPDDKLLEFKTGFLAMCPVPKEYDEEGNLLPLMTELQWFKEWIKRDVLRAYKHGKLKLAQESVQFDEGIMI